MNKITNEKIIDAFKRINLPGNKQNIIEQNRVSGIHIANTEVIVTLNVEGLNADTYPQLEKEAEGVLQEISGGEKIRIILTQHKALYPTPNTPPRPASIPGVKQIIAVGSCKGGVGKSTVTLNLALALKAQGVRVGIVDCDIYGASLPQLMGIKSRPHIDENKKIEPVWAHDIPCASMGFFSPENDPILWRGPMVSTAVQQLFRDVKWPQLDLLLVDLPPGTGDIHITLIQKLPLDGAVIVTTPQDLALMQAHKAISMYNRLSIPVLGLIENMNLFECPSCGHQSHIFGHNPTKTSLLADKIPFLGSLPLDSILMSSSELEEPFILKQEGHPITKIFQEIALKITRQIESL